MFFSIKVDFDNTAKDHLDLLFSCPFSASGVLKPFRWLGLSLVLRRSHGSQSKRKAHLQESLYHIWIFQILGIHSNV